VCAGALVAARVVRVVYGATADEKAGAAYCCTNASRNHASNTSARHSHTGSPAEECAALIKEFLPASAGAGSNRKP